MEDCFETLRGPQSLSVITFRSGIVLRLGIGKESCQQFEERVRPGLQDRLCILMNAFASSEQLAQTAGASTQSNATHRNPPTLKGVKQQLGEDTHDSCHSGRPTSPNALRASVL